MKKVIIESPLAGLYDRNIIYARRALKDSLLNHFEAPIASHLLHPQVLHDAEPGERKIGIDAGLAWYDSADLIVFYEDYGFSPGMKAALELARQMNKEIEFRKIGENIEGEII